MRLTQSCRKCSEDKTIRILEEAHPLDTTPLPLYDQACAVQQSVHVTMAMRLALNKVWVILLYCQVGVIVCQACYLSTSCSSCSTLFNNGVNM